MPNVGTFSPDGHWVIEGYGVAPDIEVVEDPARFAAGEDDQLDVAIEEMLAEIKEHGYQAPTRPRGPDRDGMGVRGEDR